MLSETIASFILVLTSVSARGFVKKTASAGAIVPAALAIALSLGAVEKMFRETSGGLTNSSVAMAIIIWQEFTLPVDRFNSHSQWTYEYAASFFIGPVAGALLAGVSYNMMQHWVQTMKDYKKNVDVTESAISEVSANQSFRSEEMATK